MMVDPNIALSSCICFIYFCRFCAKTISDLNCILLMPKLATGVMMSTCLQGLCRLACCKPGLGKCITVVWFICNGYRSLMSRYTIYENNIPHLLINHKINEFIGAWYILLRYLLLAYVITGRTGERPRESPFFGLILVKNYQQNKVKIGSKDAEVRVLLVDFGGQKLVLDAHQIQPSIQWIYNEGQ